MGGGVYAHAPPLKTVCHSPVDSTLDVGYSALSSRLAVAHPGGHKWSAHQEALQTCWGYFRPKGKQAGLGGLGGGCVEGRGTYFLGSLSLTSPAFRSAIGSLLCRASGGGAVP